MRLPQPTPEVTAADVERVVRRDYPPEHHDSVLAVLNEYGSERWHLEHDRVRLAVLKLANRDLQQVRQWLAVAKADWREVLGPAEYPLYGRKWFRMDEMSEEEQKKIIDKDWEQYRRWFEG